MVRLRYLLLAGTFAGTSGCASQPAALRTVTVEQDDPAARAAVLGPALDGYRAAYVLTWNGARIGDAREHLRAAGDAEGGYRFERTERVNVRRQGALSASRTQVMIDLDQNLSARRVVVDRWAGPARTHGEAVRLRDETWRVTFGTGPVRFVDGNAVPSTLVPLIVAGGGVSPGRAFDGPVLEEGAGLVTAQLSLDISKDHHLASARVTTTAGEVRGEAQLDERGFVAAAGSRPGLASQRVAEATLDDPFEPPEIVAPSAVSVSGRADTRRAMHLHLSDVRAPAPSLADLPFQHVTPGADGAFSVAIDAVPDRRAYAEIRERTHHVHGLLQSDLAVAALAPDEALAAGRGDCTAHAVVLAKLLAERGYTARLVTGFVLVENELRRHRWVAVKVGRDWVAVDPMFDEVPASPAHLALAVHGPTLDELAFVDDVAFAGWDDAHAELVP